jgi:hypothetical protein
MMDNVDYELVKYDVTPATAWSTPIEGEWININKPRFKAWLQSFPKDDSIVGYTQGACPLEKFLRQTFPFEGDGVRITTTHVHVREGYGPRYEMPLWAREFVCAILGVGLVVDVQPKQGTAITKRHALAALAGLQEKYYHDRE